MLRDLFDLGGIPYRDRGTNVGRDFLNICCPFCGEVRYHCGIHEHDLWFRCWVCGAAGQWYKVRRKLEEVFPDVPWDRLRPRETEASFVETQKEEKARERLFRDFVFPDDNAIMNWLVDEPVLRELDSPDKPRGMPRDVMEDVGAKVGVGRLRGYVVFPQGGNVVARKYAPQVVGPRWWKRVEKEPFLFGRDWVERIRPKHGVVTEGVFDSLRLPLGCGVAVLGSTFSSEMVSAVANAFAGAERVTLAFDRDVKAERVVELRLSLLDVGLEVKSVDWNEFDADVKDLDEIALNYTPERVANFCGLTLDQEVEL